jgi:hypothetical protein
VYPGVLPCKSRRPHLIIRHDTDLLPAVLDATDNLGVDAVLQLADSTNSSVRTATDPWHPATVDALLQCLGAHSHFCTVNQQLELDAAQARLLRLKNASLHCLSDDAWLVAPMMTGRLLHALSEYLVLLANGEIVAPLGVDPLLVGDLTEIDAVASEFKGVSSSGDAIRLAGVGSSLPVVPLRTLRTSRVRPDRDFHAT